MRHRRVIFLVFALLLVGGILATANQFSRSRTTQLFGDIVARVETEKPIVALTFDDGPSEQFTPDVLAILEQHDVKATFFLTGREAEQSPHRVTAIHEAGHEIGNHSFSHFRMILTRPHTVADEIERTDAALRAAGYQGALHFRPPYGRKFVTLPWYLAAHDRKTIMWDVEPESYPDIAGDADAITRHVLEKARNGSIILLHVMYDSRNASRMALPKIIEKLKQRGFDFVTVSRLLEER